MLTRAREQRGSRSTSGSLEGSMEQIRMDTIRQTIMATRALVVCCIVNKAYAVKVSDRRNEKEGIGTVGKVAERATSNLPEAFRRASLAAATFEHSASASAPTPAACKAISANPTYRSLCIRIAHHDEEPEGGGSGPRPGERSPPPSPAARLRREQAEREEHGDRARRGQPPSRPREHQPPHAHELATAAAGIVFTGQETNTAFLP